MRRSLFSWPLASHRGHCHFSLSKRSYITSAEDKMTAPPKTRITGCTSDDDFYAYRSQRWMWNESEQLRQRYMKFNINGLVSVAEEAAGKNSICTLVAKMVEGNFNKAFMATMNDGTQLVVKIPNPNAGRKHYTTSSEVATMQYLRSKLEVPVPKVLAYCSDAGESPLGTEYIILEKAPGIELARVWDDLEPRQKSTVVKKVADVTGRISRATFPYYGSLYYRDDLPESERMAIDDHYAIGPTTARRWFDDRRDEVYVHRGPWSSAHELIEAMMQREIACLNKFSSFSPDCQQGIFNGPGSYHPTHGAKLGILHDFQKILPHIIPRQDPLNSGILWHNDLHLDNIFVDTNNPTSITSLIDWQATPVYPSFLAARHPSMINFDGPMLPRFTKPNLPDNIKEMNPQDKQAAKNLFLAQSLWLQYEIHVQQHAPDLMQGFHAAESLQCQLLSAVGSVFDDGEPYVQSIITDLVMDEELWGKIVGTDESGRPSVPCPLRYTPQEVQRQKEEFELWERDIERKQHVVEEIGAYTGWNGAVVPDEYDEMKKRLEKAKMNFLDREAKTPAERKSWESVWPFQDKD